MCEVIYEDESYRCQIELLEGRPLFHVDVKHELKVSDVRRGRRAFKAIKEEMQLRGYEYLYAVTPSPHFAQLLGGGHESIQQIMLEDKVLEMIVWELKQLPS